MSLVTDLVFIATCGQDATAFQNAVQQHQGYWPFPLDSADHCTSLWVFHIGVDYMKPELYEWLKAGPATGWSRDTVLYLSEETVSGADITVWPVN